MKYIFAGPNPQGSSWKKLEKQLQDVGLYCAAKWGNAQDKKVKSANFMIIACGNPLYKIAVAHCKKHGMKHVLPVGKSFGAIMKALRDADIIDSRLDVKKLYGFYDPVKAETPAPLTTPLLTAKDVEKISHPPIPVGITKGSPVITATNQRPVFVGGSFFVSGAEAQIRLGLTNSWDWSEAVSCGEYNGRVIRRATMGEIIENVPGAFHEEVVMKKKSKENKPAGFGVFLEEERVYGVCADKKIRMRPICVDDEAFRGASIIADLLEVGPGTITNWAKKNGKTKSGMKIRYATLEEALSIAGAFRDEKRDRNIAAVKPKAVLKAPVVVENKLTPADKLISKIREIVDGDKNIDVKIATIEMLLEYEDASTKLASKLHEIIVTSQDNEMAMAKVSVLLDWELG